MCVMTSVLLAYTGVVKVASLHTGGHEPGQAKIGSLRQPLGVKIPVSILNVDSKGSVIGSIKMCL